MGRLQLKKRNRCKYIFFNIQKILKEKLKGWTDWVRNAIPVTGEVLSWSGMPYEKLKHDRVGDPQCSKSMSVEPGDLLSMKMNWYGMLLFFSPGPAPPPHLLLVLFEKLLFLYGIQSW